MYGTLSEPSVGMPGLIVLDGVGKVVSALGTGRDSRLQNLAQDADWIETARDRRLVPWCRRC